MKTHTSVLKIIGVSFFLFLGMTVNAQDKVSAAFAKSYEHEYAGHFTEAIKVLKNVYDDKSYEINLRLGWLHYSAGLFTESSTYYQKSIKLLPMSIEARLGLALPLSAIGDWDRIVTTYNEILNIDPNHSTTNYRLGLIYYGKEDYKAAEKLFQKVVNLYPFDYDSLLMLGWTKYFLGKTQEAKVLFNKVLLISPNDVSALEGLGLL